MRCVVRSLLCPVFRVFVCSPFLHDIYHVSRDTLLCPVFRVLVCFPFLHDIYHVSRDTFLQANKCMQHSRLEPTPRQTILACKTVFREYQTPDGCDIFNHDSCSCFVHHHQLRPFRMSLMVVTPNHEVPTLAVSEHLHHLPHHIRSAVYSRRTYSMFSSHVRLQMLRSAVCSVERCCQPRHDPLRVLRGRC